MCSSSSVFYRRCEYRMRFHIRKTACDDPIPGKRSLACQHLSREISSYLYLTYLARAREFFFSRTRVGKRRVGIRLLFYVFFNESSTQARSLRATDFIIHEPIARNPEYARQPCAPRAVEISSEIKEICFSSGNILWLQLYLHTHTGI